MFISTGMQELPFIFVHDSFYDVNDLKNNLIRILARFSKHSPEARRPMLNQPSERKSYKKKKSNEQKSLL